MDSSLLISGLCGAVGGSAAVAGLSRWLGDAWLGRMLEKEKAKYAKEIENLRSGFAQDLEHYRAQLDRSIFVSELWRGLSRRIVVGRQGEVLCPLYFW
jgi:hypothetical protein